MPNVKELHSDALCTLQSPWYRVARPSFRACSSSKHVVLIAVVVLALASPLIAPRIEPYYSHLLALILCPLPSLLTRFLSHAPPPIFPGTFDSPIRPLLIQHAMPTVPAANGLAALERHVLVAVAALVVHCARVGVDLSCVARGAAGVGVAGGVAGLGGGHFGDCSVVGRRLSGGLSEEGEVRGFEVW